MKRCEQCGRPILSEAVGCGRSHKPIAYLAVEHGFYGCDSGCCGHTVVAYDEDDAVVDSGDFTFEHPEWAYGENKGWQQEFNETFAREQCEEFETGGSHLLRLDESSVSVD